jgi:hypothetical protein
VDVDREGKPNRIEVGRLLLDVDNLRLGELEKGIGQASVLDMIVERFGVEDFLSSLAINGFFSAEPLVCRANGNGSFTVVEGNRRLAASLIILGDQRARNQGTLHQRFSRVWADHGKPPIDPIPVIEFEGERPSESLLAYLGEKHIASAQAWDSYAKAGRSLTACCASAPVMAKTVVLKYHYGSVWSLNHIVSSLHDLPSAIDNRLSVWRHLLSVYFNGPSALWQPQVS